MVETFGLGELTRTVSQHQSLVPDRKWGYRKLWPTGTRPHWRVTV
jgi:hypothetical protein